MELSPFSNPAGQTIQREQMTSLMQTALFMGETRFARQAALAWLAAYPGDLPVNLVYAQALLQEGRPEQALSILHRLAGIDPEYLEAARVRLDAEIKLQASLPSQPAASKNTLRRQGSAPLAETMGCVFALGGAEEPGNQAKTRDATSAIWSQQVRQARQALEQYTTLAPKSARNLEQADQLLIPALAAELQTPLVAVTHLRILRARGTPPQSLRGLGEHFRQRWPDCVQFQLLLSESLMALGETDQAVSLLHQAVAGDITGQVAVRLWGEDHPYRVLWPARLETSLDLPIPAAVSAAMGWNQLPEKASGPAYDSGAKFTPNPGWRASKSAAPGEPARQAAPPAIPESLISIQDELEHIADRLHQPALARSDGRYPVYVLLCSRKGLRNRYGEAAAQVEKGVADLARAIGERRDWRALVFFADEGLQSAIKPARHNDPWSIKLALTDLDAVLWRKGEMVGAVLIVGGPEVVPFHHLPNPVDDTDDDVASDNPYGTRDENYFIQEWAVGRLPGGSGNDPSALVSSLQVLTNRHAAIAREQQRLNPWQRFIQKLRSWLHPSSNGRRPVVHKQASFGYTAAVWKQASLSVFLPIGQARALQASPPLGIDKTPASPLPSARLGYFNLHGLADSVEWFGQSDPADILQAGLNYREFPVAVRPQDVVNSGHAPDVVFSEACYGANIIKKGIEESLALKFLQSGTQAVVGSTCIAYGSITTPLTAADYLGHTFWSAIRQGVPAGEALRRAKLALAREMHRRQGYLDGEDQKTLISFVLYGDPLAQPMGQGKESKSILRPIKVPRGLRTICDRSREVDSQTPLPGDVTETVRQIVQKYLPGMQDAHLSMCTEHSECSVDGHTCPTAQLQTKSGGENLASPHRRVVVLSKQVSDPQRVHQRYARITLDPQNRMVKLVVSR